MYVVAGVLHNKKKKEKVRKRGVGRPAAAAVEFLMDLRLGVLLRQFTECFNSFIPRNSFGTGLLLYWKTFWDPFCSASSFFTSLFIDRPPSFDTTLSLTLEHQRVCETVVVTSAQR